MIDIAFNRTIQALLFIVRRFLRSPNQLTFIGEGSVEHLAKHVLSSEHRRVLLVTDEALVGLGFADRVLKALTAGRCETIVYDGVLPDPSFAIVENALDRYVSGSCDAVIALGGGSSIDTAKAVAAAATNGGVEKIMGFFRVKQKPAPLYAIPTTAGTGSEASLFAVISENETRRKVGIGSPALVPSAVALDPGLMTGLPRSLTAFTGMDALTHAIETYISTASNDDVRSYSAPAVKMIFKYLPRAWEDGDDVEAREGMAVASYYAGTALNIAAVGYVHAIAHQLGARYGTPHGLANAVAMPHVLDLNLDAAREPLAELAKLIDVAAPGDDERTCARKFVESVRDLGARVGIPSTIAALSARDIPELVKGVRKEGRIYAVPRVLGGREITDVLHGMTA